MGNGTDSLSEVLGHTEIIARLAARAAGPVPDRPYQGVRIDDRAEEGELFVAIRGTRYDSHQSIPQLFERGVRGVVGERSTCPDPRLCYYQVADSRRAWALLEQAMAGEPARSLRVFGVTGTNGKSTTVRLLASILEAAGRKVGWMGTVSQRLGGDERPSRLTTADPRELAHGMREFVDCGGQDLVLEVSSHALHQERVAAISFAGAILTNLTRDHFDYHGSYEEYLLAKRSLFERLAPDAPAVLPYGDVFKASDPIFQSLQTLFFGDGSEDGVRVPAGFASVSELNADSTRGRLQILSDSLDFESRLTGRHNLRNITAAALLARAVGVPVEAIARGIAAAPPVPGRLESVPGGTGTIFVDYAHTPDALSAVLTAVGELKRGRLSVVFGCGGDRDRGKRPEMGAIAERLADRVFVTSDNPRTEDPQKIVSDIVSGMRAPRTAEVLLDRRAAIAAAVADLTAGDILVVAGKGHERDQIVGTTRHAFDDREVLRELLHGGGA